MRLSVLIVNWNTCEDLRECLQALVNHPLEGGTQEVIVVDNASTDGSVTMVRTTFPHVRLISNESNLIYAHATNQALSAATGDFVLLLNPDAQVTAGTLNTLLAELEGHPAAGAVAARLVHPQTSSVSATEAMVTQPSIRGFPEPLPLFADILGLSRLFPKNRKLGAYRQRFFDYNIPGPAPQPMTSCLAITRRCYEAVGGMDERFPLYFNDVDWCLRCWKAGYEIRYTPEAIVVHEGGGTTRKVRKAAIWESHRSLLRFYAKHYKATTSAVLYGVITLLVVLGAWVRTKRWGQSLGVAGGETTPEELRLDFQRGN